MNGITATVDTLSKKLDFMVFEAGVYSLQDGTVIKAGVGSSSSRWATIDLSESGFTDDPLVFTQVVTTNGPEAVTTRVRYANPNSFQVRIQEQQANNPQSHTTESVAYIAVSQGGGDLGQFKYESTTVANVTHQTKSFDFGQDFDSVPVMLAAMQTYNGGDVATVRLRDTARSATGANIFLEEERSADNEVRHGRETVGYFAISHGEIFGDQNGGDDPSFLRMAGSLVPGYAGLPDYVSTNQPELWQALAQAQEWGDEIVGGLGDSGDQNDDDDGRDFLRVSAESFLQNYVAANPGNRGCNC